MKDDELLPVAIWVTAGPGQSLAERQAAAFAAVAAKYPEAREAMQRSGKPMDVNDPVLAKQIEAEYIALMKAEMNARIQPLVNELKQRGFAVTVFEGMPSITAVLPKSTIIESSRRDDVSAIYLIEEGSHPELDLATPEALAPAKSHQGEQPAVNLPFQSVEHASGTGELYEDRQPGVIVISTAEEVAKLDGRITPESLAQLQTLDYQKHLAIAVFQGWKPADGFDIPIEP